MMKKIILLATIVFLLFSARSAFAATPTCDPKKVDLTLSIVGLWAAGHPGTSQSDCNAKYPGKNYIFCDSSPVIGVIAGSPGCWSPGVTKVSPQCPPKSYAWPACTNPFGIGCLPQVCCTEALDPTKCLDKKNIVPREYCPGNGIYTYKNGECVQKFTSPWELKAKCDGGRDGIQTAIGCIPISSETLTGENGFLSFLLKFAFGLSGAIILFMIILTGYTLLTSAGNPEKLQVAKENIVSILSGLVLIAFSLILLQTIGADVLQLPTFR